MDDVSEIALEFPAGEGMAYFSVEALENACAFYGGYYSTDLKEEYASPVKIGIGICTFKRESFIEHNCPIPGINNYSFNRWFLQCGIKKLVNIGGKSRHDLVTAF